MKENPFKKPVRYMVTNSLMIDKSRNVYRREQDGKLELLLSTGWTDKINQTEVSLIDVSKWHAEQIYGGPLKS
jgi:hypothetical protein